jgi:predicted nucleic acid-binding protein
VISEACFLLSRVRDGQDAVFELLSEDILKVDFRLSSEVDSVRALMRKFQNVPMSFADACLVRMSELDPSTRILTLDSDFRVYRRNSRQAIPTVMPGRGGGG